MRTELSSAIVRITRDFTGRGPTHSRTVIDREAVFVLLFDSLTRGEQVLVEHGEQEQVLELRRTFQSTMRGSYTAAIERILRREVTSFLSANSVEPDVASEIFLLGRTLPAEADPATAAAGPG
ncbi:Na-translocating system protein MpsC family protein [Patulibacter sp.]|uniref:Na-translocating system protein MpsC family protein n=1 Tax=Patulibacter sp. TaxID=1912859 RepID=UPI002718F36E|nr:Na-translocating system protein MpsC family protein [Patulibacter sp.]MDO9410896.1 Na-translocating system protein MpsC family protein [Patulibacter sp.]